MEQRKTNPPPASSPVIVQSPRARIRPIAATPEPVAPRARKRRPVPFKKADLARALTAAAKAGFMAGSIEVAKDGTIRIFAAGKEPNVGLFDQWADKL